MPKYDAFGREIGEDTLAAWRQEATPVEQERDDAAFRDAEPIVTAADAQFGDGESTVPPADAAPPVTDGDPVVTVGEPTDGRRTFTIGDATVTIGEPIVIHAGAADSPPDDAPPIAAASGAAAARRASRVAMPRVRRRPRVVSRLILLLVVIGLGATLAINAGREIEDAIRDVPGMVPAPPEAAAPVGLQAGSLIRPTELRRALAQLRARRIGRVETLRLAPERIDAALISSGGRLQSVQLRHDGAFQEFASTPGLGHLRPPRPGSCARPRGG